MKIRFVIAIALLFILAYSQLVSAHEIQGKLGSKKSTATATDIFLVTCPDPTTSQLVISIKGVTPTRPKFRSSGQTYWNGALVSIQAVDTISGSASAVVTDKRGGTKDCRKFSDGGDSCFTDEIALQSGQGPYQLIVTKPQSKKRGPVIYEADVHCLKANGNHTTDEEVTKTQNQ
jgi:hypothetical protein